MDPPPSLVRRSPKPAVALPERVAVQIMNEGMAIRTHRHEIHQTLRTEILVSPVVEVHAGDARTVADETVLRELGRPIALADSAPLGRLDVGPVLVGAVLCAARCGHVNDDAV